MKIIDINGDQRDCEQVLLDKQYPGFVTVEFKSKNNPSRSHFEWYPIDDFTQKNPKLSQILGNPTPPPKGDLGIVTHSGDFYLEDTTKDWQNNIFVGFMVWISRGTGESQVRTIKSNTKNTLTIDPPWTLLPDQKSQYVISRDIHDVKILNNQLPQFQT